MVLDVTEDSTAVSDIIEKLPFNDSLSHPEPEMGSLVYSSGLKFDTTLAKNLDESYHRVRHKKASLIIIDGGVGEGKTTLGTEAAIYLAGRLDQQFSIPDQVTMGGSEFLKGMDWCVTKKRNVIVYDEAGDFNTRASLTYFNQNMNRVFETYRALGIVVILCLPHFNDLDTSLMKKKICRMLVHCYSRNDKYGKYKVYSLWRMWYLKAKMQKFTVPDDAYRNVTPNFHGHFLDLDPVDSKELENHSISGKKHIIKKGMLQDKGLLPAKTIADRTGYSIPAIRQFFAKRKIKGQKEGNTYYFPKEYVDAILQTKEKEGTIF